ncbi:MAG: methyltransferase, partial [bacterium]|nr:methyltransferase [bacterium]
MNRLLNALAGMNLLEKNGALYTDTADSRLLLSKHSTGYTGFIISHHHSLSKTWSRLDEAISSGKSFRSDVTGLDDTQVENFLMGMHNTASLNAAAVIEKCDLSGTRRLLDLGGGPGTYAIRFCQKHPQLKAAVFDLPATRSFAEGNFAKHGLAERIEFIEGNFNNDAIPGQYDAIWMSHILHGEGDDACTGIIKKALAALAPGGKIIIHEFILENNRTEPLFPAL